VKIDLSGIAKGYAVDAAARALRAAGATDALVDLTGNMFALGSPPGSDHWRIGIRDPRDRMPNFARLRLYAGEGISTSGKYEQFVAQDGKTYGHIMDPRTGRPAEGLISVTVVARSAFDADTWDTPLFVLGAEGARRKAKERDSIAAVLVEPGTGGVDTVWVESSLKDRFALEPAARDLFRVEFY
jgi:thiamine biosynthesis lipoprotein